MTEPTPHLPIPATLKEGRYRLGETLGEGGMGVVVKAHDTTLGVDRAIKLLFARGNRTATLRRRLQAEARAMARIQHPNILGVHDMGTEAGLDFVVMDLARASLSDRMKAGPLSPTLACHYMIQVLSALAAAHEEGVVHRDVKPHNILLDKNGRALLADFGIALLTHEVRRTRSGVAMGSVAYMPPEQRLDAAKVGPAADLYATGSTMYHLVTGENPVDLFLAAEDSARWENVPESLLPVIQRACKLDPDARFDSASEMAVALMERLDDPSMSWEGVTLAPPTDTTTHDPTAGAATASEAHTPTQDDAIGGFGAFESRSATVDATQDAIDRLPATTRTTPAPVPSVAPARAPRDRRPLYAIAALLALLVGLLALRLATRPSHLDLPTSIADRTPPEASPSPVSPSDPTSSPEAVTPAEAPPAPDPTPVTPEPDSPTPATSEPAPAPHPARPQGTPSAPEPAEVSRAAGTVAGGWEGAIGGILVTLQVSGADDALRGTVVSTFGPNTASKEVVGAYDPESRMLRLSDVDTDALDAARYTLELSSRGDRLSGTVTRNTGGVRSMSLSRR